MERQNKERKAEDYSLIVFNHQTHKQLWGINFNRLTLILAVVTVVICLIIIFYVLVAFTPLRTTIPGYPNATSRIAVTNMGLRIDSLENVISRWDFYSENLRRVIEGEDPLKIDSLIHSGVIRQSKSKEELNQQDSAFRAHIANEQQFELTNQEHRDLPIEGIHFFSPLKGTISQGYDPVVHPFTDITAPANSVVVAILDGTVIFDGWTDDSGYVIQIQHDNDIVTSYKHNNKLLKKTGDKVSAGMPISLVGGTGALSTGDHLHFELWYRGEPVDPTKYISF